MGLKGIKERVALLWTDHLRATAHFLAGKLTPTEERLRPGNSGAASS
jgi:hypothetical protein